MKDNMYAVIAVIGAILAVFLFVTYRNQADAESANTLYLVGAIIATVVTIVCAAIFLSGRVNKTDDIHITE